MPGDVTLEFGARCMECDWACSGDKSDKQAEKHTKETKHPTASWARPLKVER